MRDYSQHNDITNRKTLAEVMADPSILYDKLLLFNRGSELYDLSGWCINPNKNLGGYFSCVFVNHKREVICGAAWDEEVLKDVVLHCDAFIGKTSEESFLLTE